MTKISDQGYPRFYRHPVVFSGRYADKVKRLQLSSSQTASLLSAASRYVVRAPGENPDIVPNAYRIGDRLRMDLPSKLFPTEEELIAHKFVLQDLS